MASSGSHSGLDGWLAKIHEGLQIEKKWQSGEASAKKVNIGFKPFEMLLNDYHSVANDSLYSSDLVKFSAGCLFEGLEKSKCLDDDKLFEAILCSRLFENPDQYDSSHHIYNEELVWVRYNPEEYYLVYGGKIIYYLSDAEFKQPREFTQKIWASLKKNVLCNLKLAFDIESDQNQSKSSLQSSQGAVLTPPTDAERTVILDELNSINPDPLLRRLFEFDLKVLIDKDSQYWRDKLELVRSHSRSATSSPKPLLRTISDPEKIARQNESSSASIVDSKQTADRDLPETISKFEQLVKDNEKQMGILSDALSKLTQLVQGQAADRDLPETISKFEQLVKDNEKQMGILSDALSKLTQLVQGQAADRKAENEKLQQLMEMVPAVEEVKKQNETCLAILTRGKDTHAATASIGSTAADTSKDSVGQQPPLAARLEVTEHPEELDEATASKATKSSVVAEKIKEWKLDEKKLQPLMRAVSCLVDIIRGGYFGDLQSRQPSKDSTQFDLVENICSYEHMLFSNYSSNPVVRIGISIYGNLSNQIRRGISLISNIIQCQQTISGFLGSQMVDISSSWPDRDFIVRLVVAHQLAKILKENVESYSKEIEDCVTRLENYAKAWNIDLPQIPQD